MAFLLLCLATRASAQDTAYSELRFRLSLFRTPLAGAITEDWHPGTGIQAEVSTPLAFGEFGMAVGHVGYAAITGRPKFAATLFTLAWMSPPARLSRLNLTAGFRLTDYRMDFDDPALVVGLRTEEEVLIGIIGRGQLPIGRRMALFADGSYGVLMLGTRTPLALIHVGAERAVATPSWLREILR